MSENKRVTFRLNEEEVEKFKAFTEEYNISQADGFSKLIEAMELNKAKAIVSDRAKEIESIESHLSAIQNIYLAALEINKNAEETIKMNYSKELNSKDQIILEFQEKNKAFKEQLEKVKGLEKTNKELNKDIEEKEQLIADKIEEVKKVNDSNSALSQVVAEYKKYKIINDDLEKRIKELEGKNSEDCSIIKDLNNKIKSTINELETIKGFYEKQINDIKSDARQTMSDMKQTYENGIKDLKEENKLIITELKTEYKIELVNNKKSYDDEIKKIKLENKQDIKAKDKVIEQLKKELEKLKIN